MTPLLRRIAALVPVVAVAAAAAAALGRPDLGAAGGLLRGGNPTQDASIALAVALVEGAIAVALFIAAVSTFRDISGAEGTAGRRLRAACVALVGAAVLAGGMARHASAAPTICCGNITEAQGLAH